MKREVVRYIQGNTEHISPHEEARIIDQSKIIARIFGDESKFTGVYQSDRRQTDYPPFFVPNKTLIGDYRHLGILTEEDLFGGVVPSPYLATKSITHGLSSLDSKRPAKWNEAFSHDIRDVVLPGHTVFSSEDATVAAGLLFDGKRSLRGKRTLAAGGADQHIIESADDLEEALRNIPPHELSNFGYVLEKNLAEVETLSVGQVTLDGLMASYVGTQYDTQDSAGKSTYGGSDLWIVRGDYDNLLDTVEDPTKKLAVEQARIFDKAAREQLDIIVSRRNYDVAQGVDTHGEFYSGVLEQSWRIGGASGPEILALEAFKKDPTISIVRGSSVNSFGKKPIPEDGVIHFSGIDPDFTGAMVVYSRLEKVTPQDFHS